MKKKTMSVPDMLSEAYKYPNPVPFSRGMRIDIKGIVILFISGTASVNHEGKTVYPNNLKKQTKRMFDNITSLLKSEGADWSNIVKTTVFLKDMKYYEELSKYRTQFFKEQNLKVFPASTCVEAKLCREDLLVEMEAIAIFESKTS